MLAPLEELQKKGTLTDRIFRKIMYEGTRPLFGGMVGWGLGAAFGEEDDEALMWSLPPRVFSKWRFCAKADPRKWVYLLYIVLIRDAKYECREGRLLLPRRQ